MGTRKIKIFVDAHVFDGEFQGSRTFIKEMYTVLSQNEGLELYMGAFDITALAKHFPTPGNIHFIKYKSRSSVKRLLFDIPAIIKRYQVQYAHFQYIIPLYKNCKYIVTIHDVLFRDYPKEFSMFYKLTKTILYKIGAARADILTTDSAFSQRSIEKYLGIKKDAIHLVPVAVNEKHFQPYDKDAAKKIIETRYGLNKFILYVSRIEPRKNHAFVLQAFIDLQLYKQGYHLVLLGHESISTPAFNKIMDGLAEDTRPFIVIKSDIPDDELLLFYRAASVFVYPSKAEGFGIPPLEAAAAGTPVICSNTSAMGDFVFFGKNHIDPFDYPSFKNALGSVITDPPDAEALSRIADAIRQKYSWANSAELLYNLITSGNK